MDILAYCRDFLELVIKPRHLVGAGCVFLFWFSFWLVVEVKGMWTHSEEWDSDGGQDIISGS